MSQQIITKNFLPKTIQKICGVDVSYKENVAFASAVVLRVKDLSIIENVNFSQTISSPYIPSLFMLREAPPILKVLKKIRSDFDLLLIDGNGILHPQKCGLASFIGIKINKPVIGVAKKLLCGTVNPDGKVEFDREILGYQITYPTKKIYVSVGNKISLRTAVRIVKELTLNRNWYPEPLRLADKNSKSFRKKSKI